MSFGGVEVRASFINATTVRVETPGHVTPRFVDVLASNDGDRFTDTAAVGKVNNPQPKTQGPRPSILKFETQILSPQP